MLSKKPARNFQTSFFSNLYRREVFITIVGMSVFLALLTVGLYVIWGSGPTLEVLPWFNPFGFIFLSLASVSVAFLALGRYRVRHDRFSYWIGIGFIASSIGQIFYVLSWPGLLSEGRSFIAQSPNTAGVLVTLFPTILAIFLLKALHARQASDAEESRHPFARPILLWCLSFTLLYTLVVLFESYLPAMVLPDGSYSPLLLIWDGIVVLLLVISSVIAVRQYRRYGDPFSAYIVFPLLAMIYAIFVTLVGRGRYDIYWYSARIVLITGHLMVLMGMLSESVRYVRQITDSEIRYRSLTNSLPQLIWSCTPDGLFNYLSRQWLAYTGFSEDQALGVLWLEQIDPDDRQRMMELWRRAAASGDQLDTETCIQSADGNYRWFKVVVLPIRDSFGQIVEWFGSCTDIENLKQTEAALKQGEQYQRELARNLAEDRSQLTAILGNLPVGVWVADQNGQLINKNHQADLIWAGDAPLVKEVDEYPQYTAWFAESGKRLSPEEYPLARALHTGSRIEPVELRILRLDGSEGSVLVSAAPILDEEGQVSGAVGINLDITERKQAEEDRLKKEIQIQVQRRLMENEEKERQQLARELHDEPLQELLATRIKLASIIETVNDNQRIRLEALQDSLLKIIEHMRSISFYLRPPVLIHHGIQKALRGQIRIFQEQYPELQVNFESEGHDVPLPEPISLTVYRIFQELLRNAQKHSRANQINIVLRTMPERLELEVHDNGVGFELPGELFDLVNAGHFGIVGIQERLDVFNGKLKVISSPENGTSVCIFVPLN